MYFAKIHPKKKIGTNLCAENHRYIFLAVPFCFLLRIKKPEASRRDEILSVIWGKMQICAHAGGVQRSGRAVFLMFAATLAALIESRASAAPTAPLVHVVGRVMDKGKYGDG